ERATGRPLYVTSPRVPSGEALSSLGSGCGRHPRSTNTGPDGTTDDRAKGTPHDEPDQVVRDIGAVAVPPERHHDELDRLDRERQRDGRGHGRRLPARTREQADGDPERDEQDH